MARKLHTVGFKCPTLATNSLIMDSRKLFVRLSLLIVLEDLRQDDKQTQPHEQLPGTQGQEDSLCCATQERYNPETVEFVEYLDSLRNVM